MNDIRRQRLFASLGVAALTAILYIITLAPSVDFIDAGELAAVAHGFGIAHPTGYPLFTILAGIWAHLPFGEVIYSLNVFAALLAAAAAGVTVQTLYLLLGIAAATGRKKGKKYASPTSDESQLPRLLSASAGALFLGLTATYWRTALSIEVYALHILLLSLLLWSAMRFYTVPNDDAAARRRALLTTALLLGLAFSNHMSTVFTLPALLLLLLHYRKAERYGKDVALAVPAFATGLLPYLYLPLRAAAQPALNWGNPIDFERFFWHVTGKQYSVWMFSSADAWQKQFGHALSTLASDTMYIGAAAAFLGLVVLFRRSRILTGFVLLLLLTCLIWAAGYDIHDIESYFLLALFALAMLTAVAVQEVQKRLHASVGNAVLRALIPGAVLVLPLLLHFPNVSQRGNHLVEDYTKNMFASIEKDALVLSFQWDYWVSAAYYYQQVEGERTDMIVLDKELFRRSWYFEQFRNSYPDLYRSVETEIDVFLLELNKFEHDLPYDAATIENAFNTMINTMIDRAYESRPVYVTIEMEQQFAPGYRRIPEGLAFRLYRPEDVPNPQDVPFPDFTMRDFDGDGRLVDGIKRMYGSMYFNRGVYLSQSGLYDDADSMLDRALQYAPGDSGILQWKQRNAQMKTGSP